MRRERLPGSLARPGQVPPLVRRQLHSTRLLQKPGDVVVLGRAQAEGGTDSLPGGTNALQVAEQADIEPGEGHRVDSSIVFDSGLAGFQVRLHGASIAPTAQSGLLYRPA